MSLEKQLEQLYIMEDVLVDGSYRPVYVQDVSTPRHLVCSSSVDASALLKDQVVARAIAEQIPFEANACFVVKDLRPIGDGSRSMLAVRYCRIYEREE